MGFTCCNCILIVATIATYVWAWDLYLKKKCINIYQTELPGSWDSLEVSVITMVLYCCLCILIILGRIFYKIYKKCEKHKEENRPMLKDIERD